MTDAQIHLSISTDITQRRQIERNSWFSAWRIGTLAGGIAHDLNNHSSIMMASQCCG